MPFGMSMLGEHDIASSAAVAIRLRPRRFTMVFGVDFMVSGSDCGLLDRGVNNPVGTDQVGVLPH